MNTPSQLPKGASSRESPSKARLEQVLPLIGLLHPGLGNPGFIALRWQTPPGTGLELSTAAGRGAVASAPKLTPTLAEDLHHHPLLAFTGMEVFSRVAQLSGRWPGRYLCLLTMVRVLENGTTPEQGVAPSLELDAVMARYGLPSGLEAGNPTPRLHKLRDALLQRLSKADLWLAYQLELKLMPITLRMHARGIGVDATLLEQVRQDYEARASVAAAELCAALNPPRAQPG